MSARFRSVRPRLVVLAALGAALAVTAGCAKSGKVSGKVTLPDGSPLPGGLILFAPEDSTHNPSSAIIKEDGTYEFRTSRPGPARCRSTTGWPG